jgi:hypothetical protein
VNCLHFYVFDSVITTQKVSERKAELSCQSVLSGGHFQNNSEFVRLEAFPAVTMKNAVFRDIKTQFIPHSKHTTSPLQSRAG